MHQIFLGRVVSSSNRYRAIFWQLMHIFSFLSNDIYSFSWGAYAFVVQKINCSINNQYPQSHQKGLYSFNLSTPDDLKTVLGRSTDRDLLIIKSLLLPLPLMQWLYKLRALLQLATSGFFPSNVTKCGLVSFQLKYYTFDIKRFVLTAACFFPVLKSMMWIKTFQTCWFYFTLVIWISCWYILRK